MSEKMDFEQTVRKYRKLKNEYFDAFIGMNDDKTELLASELGKLYKSIQKELALKKPITLTDKKDREELNKIKENKDSLLAFYRKRPYVDLDFDSDTFDFTRENWISSDEDESVSPNTMYWRLIFSYPGKIVDIRTEVINKELSEELIEALVGYTNHLIDNEDWDIDACTDRELSNYLFNYVPNFIPQKERQAELTAIITESNLSPVMLGHFDTIKSCYCTGQYSAAIVFCRALLEEVYQQIYGDTYRKELGKRDQTLGTLLYLIQEGKIVLADYEKIEKVNKTANHILHDVLRPKDTEGSEVVLHEKGGVLLSDRKITMESMKDVALRCIKDTIFLKEKAAK